MKKLNRILILFVVLLMIGAASITTLSPENSQDIIANPVYWLVAVAAFFLIIGFIATFEALDAMKKMIKGSQAEGSEDAEVEEEKDWAAGLLQSLTDAAPLDKEDEVATDHEYDGIRELDNNLPPWWLIGFYASMVFAVIYLLRYHVFQTAPLSIEELKIELAEAEAAKVEYLKTAANLVDESNVEMLTEESRILAGGETFTQNCAICHAADGGGSIGPNLTDAYWIYGNDIKDVFKTIKYGTSNGMTKWDGMLSPSKMQEVASYVLSLQGTTPASPKEPQGDLVEAAPTEEAASDSTATQTDSTVVEETAISSL